MPNRPGPIMIWQFLKPLRIFPKGLFGGLIFATAMWISVILCHAWSAIRDARKLGYAGPLAIAGGWQYLIQAPWVVVLLSVAFGIGFYFAVAWAALHP